MRTLSIAVGAVLVASLVPGIARSQQVSGLLFDAKVTLQTPQEGGGMALTAMGRFANGVLRIDPKIVAGAGPIVDGEYIIINQSGSFSVRPGDSTYTEKSIGVGTFTSIINSINRGGSIGNFVAQVDSLGPGELIEGRPTRHYRVVYTFTTFARGGQQETRNTYEYWLADVGAPLVNPFDGRTSVAGSRRIMIVELAPKLDAAWAKMGQGTVVKIVGTNGQGFTRRIDLTNVKAAQFEAGMFEIPKGFRRATPGGAGY